MQQSAPGTDRSWEAARRQRIEDLLARNLPDADAVPQRLHQAMRYSVLGPGKRARPLLVYATADALGIPYGQVDSAAIAVELIHAYSRSTTTCRRWMMTTAPCRLTTHRARRATAILAGDALQVPHRNRWHRAAGWRRPGARHDSCPAAASGTRGMAGGQPWISPYRPAPMPRGRGDAGARSGFDPRHCTDGGEPEHRCWLPGGTRRDLAAPPPAFQIVDDLLDAGSGGHRQGDRFDAARQANVPSAAGVAGARTRVRELIVYALGALADFGPGAAHICASSLATGGALPLRPPAPRHRSRSTLRHGRQPAREPARSDRVTCGPARAATRGTAALAAERATS